MMTRMVLVSLVSSVFFGCATAPAPGRAMEHGALVTYGPSVREIVRGPVTLRAYSGFAGGRVFVARDCAATPSAGLPVKADQRLSVEVPAGSVACLATQNRRPFELLWRARGVQSSAVVAAR